jgi:hypothetical protein
MTELYAILAVVILGGLAIFQAALAFGAPIGHFAWGGAHKVLPQKLRISSAVSIVLYGFFAAIILSRAGLISFGDAGLIGTATWILFGYFSLGVVMNGISRSKPERAVMTPVAASLAVLYLLVALS